MSDLTPKQRAYLRRLAHHLKPVVHVGAEGVTDGVIRSVLDALNTRELIKIRVLEGAPEKARPTGARIAAAIEGAHVPQTIGRVVVLYRRHPENPEIELPSAGE